MIDDCCRPGRGAGDATEAADGAAGRTRNAAGALDARGALAAPWAKDDRNVGRGAARVAADDDNADAEAENAGAECSAKLRRWGCNGGTGGPGSAMVADRVCACGAAGRVPAVELAMNDAEDDAIRRCECCSCGCCCSCAGAVAAAEAEEQGRCVNDAAERFPGAALCATLAAAEEVKRSAAIGANPHSSLASSSSC